MAVDNFPHLTAMGRALAVRQMQDVCKITHDPLDVEDAVMNQATGRLEDNRVTTYQGPCTLRDTVRYSQGDEGGKQVAVRDYTISIPSNAAVLHEGDWVEILSCSRIPGLAGTKFRVSSPIHSTFEYETTATCELAAAAGGVRP